MLGAFMDRMNEPASAVSDRPAGDAHRVEANGSPPVAFERFSGPQAPARLFSCHGSQRKAKETYPEDGFTSRRGDIEGERGPYPLEATGGRRLRRGPVRGRIRVWIAPRPGTREAVT